MYACSRYSAFADAATQGLRALIKSRVEAPESVSLQAPLVLSVSHSERSHDYADEDLQLARHGRLLKDLLAGADWNDQVADLLRGSWKRQKVQLLTMMKTLLLFSREPLWRVVALTNSVHTFGELEELLKDLPGRQRILLEYAPQWFPMYGRDEFMVNWRPGSWSKQFLAESLPEETAAVFVDSDAVFLGPAEQLWQELAAMTPKQLVSLAPEPHYLREDRAFAGLRGVNTGVVVANLTAQRAWAGGGHGLGWSMLYDRELNPINNYTRHDQDSVNVYLHHHPQLLREMSPRFNFIVTSCEDADTTCPECTDEGVVVLHGSDAVFYRMVDSKFLEVYRYLSEADLGASTPEHHLQEVWARLRRRDWRDDTSSCRQYRGMNLALTRGLQRLKKGH